MTDPNIVTTHMIWELLRDLRREHAKSAAEMRGSIENLAHRVNQLEIADGQQTEAVHRLTEAMRDHARIDEVAEQLGELCATTDRRGGGAAIEQHTTRRHRQFWSNILRNPVPILGAMCIILIALVGLLILIITDRSVSDAIGSEILQGARE